MSDHERIRIHYLETAIGRCGIFQDWSKRSMAGVQLPERDEDATRNRISGALLRRAKLLPPDVVLRAIDGIVALLSGEPRDLTHVTIDTDGVADFNRRVYAIARTIAPGATLSYGEIAARLGDRNLARDVGQALGRIRSRSSCPVIACSPPAASWATSPRRAVSSQNCGFSPSRARGRAVRAVRPVAAAGAAPPGVIDPTPHVPRSPVRNMLTYCTMRRPMPRLPGLGAVEQCLMPDDEIAGAAADGVRAQHIEVLLPRVGAARQGCDQASPQRWNPGTIVKAPCSGGVSVK